MLRGGKALPLFERVADAAAPFAVLLPATLSAPTWAGAPTSPANVDHNSSDASSTNAEAAAAVAGSSGSLHPSVAGRLRPGDLHWDVFMELAPAGGGAGFAALSAARAAGVAPYGTGGACGGGAAAAARLMEEGGHGSCLHLAAAPDEPTNILFSSGTTVSEQSAVGLVSCTMCCVHAMCVSWVQAARACWQRLQKCDLLCIADVVCTSIRYL